MYQIKNCRNGKIVKNAINRKPLCFNTIEEAEKMASNLVRNSTINASAWNNIRPSKYIVISI